LVFRSKNDEPDALLRDFKSYTAKKRIEAIETNPQESRKDYLLWFFERAAKKKNNSSKYQFWQHHNKPIESQRIPRRSASRFPLKLSFP
jgi:hypothetical protein